MTNVVASFIHKAILVISSTARGFHVCKDIKYPCKHGSHKQLKKSIGSHPSVTNSPVKGDSIIALTNLPSKLSTS